MSEEHTPEDDYIADADNEDGEEWEEEDEEVCPQEVERVIHQLDQILEKVESDSIHTFVTEAYERIEGLVDWEDDEQAGGESHSEAA